ncbi:MAG: mycothiol synthase [Gaiellales bacterium]|nr:mycothiol synthase [Gaiellales bacterium]
MLAIIRAMDLAYIGETESTLEDLQEEWDELDFEHNAWVVESGGETVGFMEVEDRGSGRFLMDGYVAPRHVGNGVGGLMVDLAEGRAAELLEQQPGGLPVELETGVLADDPRAGPLLESRGYGRTRVFVRMVTDLEERPYVPDSPDGIRIESFRIEDAAAVHAAHMDAMNDHWRYSPSSLEKWLERTRRARFDAGLWFIAWDGDEVAGVLFASWKRNDMGWIDTVAVRRPWRGRGIASALLQRSFAAFWDRGERRCGLGVDADSPTGAGRVYERAGMRRHWRIDVYAKQLRD